MEAVRHLGFVGAVFGPPTMSTWWSLVLCKICLESMYIVAFIMCIFALCSFGAA